MVSTLYFQDIESINMDDFRHNYVNVTGFRMVNVQNPTTKDILQQMRTYEKHAGVKLLNQSQVIKVRSAVYHKIFIPLKDVIAKTNAPYIANILDIPTRLPLLCS